MAHMEIGSFLSGDGDTVTIQMTMDGKALGHIVLAPEQVDRFIASLATERARCGTQVPAEPDTGAPLAAVMDPGWTLSAVTMTDHLPVGDLSARSGQGAVPSSPIEAGVLLSVRHPGFSWLPFLLSAVQASALASALLDAHAFIDSLSRPKH